MHVKEATSDDFSVIFFFEEHKGMITNPASDVCYYQHES